MSELKNYGIALDSIDKSIGLVDNGIVSKLIDKAYLPEHKANEFLCDQAIKNSYITDEDIEKAATIYGSYKLKKAYVNIYKARKKADALIKTDNNVDYELDEDWFSVYEEHVSKVSDDSVLDMWAAVLAGKIMKIGSFRKVMLDRLALLDYQSINAFTQLCYRTITLSLSNGKEFKIPFYICKTETKEMEKFEISKLTSDELSLYNRNIPSESELNILEEIGLVSLGDDFETIDFSNEDELNFTISDGKEVITPFSIIQKGSEYYKTLWTGSVMYTPIGMELYNILKSKYIPQTYLMPVVKKYNLFMKAASDLQKKNEKNPFYYLKKDKDSYYFFYK